jgi:hypothetical protein
MSDPLADIYGSSSSWLKASDLQGGKPIVTIEAAEVRENNYNGETKKQIVLTFEGKEKVLGLNVTNARRIADLTGTSDYHEWVGYKLKLFVDKTEVDGRTVDCIRIFPELPEQPAHKVAAASANDDVPF